MNISGGGRNAGSDADDVDRVDDDDASCVDDHGSEKTCHAMRLLTAVPGTCAARVHSVMGPCGKRISQSTTLDVSETASDSPVRIAPVVMFIVCCCCSD